MTRFPDGDHAASYLGLVPSTKQSAACCYHGPITKRGNSQARWMLIEAAQHLDKHPGPLGHFFRRLCRKKNRNVAVVAAARKLACIGWRMLVTGERRMVKQAGCEEFVARIGQTQVVPRTKRAVTGSSSLFRSNGRGKH